MISSVKESDNLITKVKYKVPKNSYTFIMWILISNDTHLRTFSSVDIFIQQSEFGGVHHMGWRFLYHISFTCISKNRIYVENLDTTRCATAFYT